MALDIKTLMTRATTAIVFVAVMLTGLFWNEYSFIALFTIVHFGCWYEFIKLLKKIYGANYLKYSLFGLVYITMPILMLFHLSIQGDVSFFNLNDNNRVHYIHLLPCLIIFSIWINDTMAYLVGSVIGKTPFSKISPKKTWEGTSGGAILCVLFIGFLFPLIGNQYFLHPVQNYIYFTIAAICAIFGTLGDLFESKLKRTANVKDSGSIMPGHVGFLDRFDSLLVAVPFVWLYVKLVM